MEAKQLIKKLIGEGKERKEIFEIVIKQTGVTYDYVRKTFKGFQNSNEDYRFKKHKGAVISKSVQKRIKVQKGSVKDIMQPDEFISGIDIVKQVIVFLNVEVMDGYIEDEKLRRRFEIGTGKWKEIKNLPVFGERMFIYTKPTGQKATVWSSKKGIKTARETISLARYEF